MADDIVPELLSKINADFDSKTANSKVLKEALHLLKNKKADFLNANAFGIEVGEILSGVLESSITPDVLPDGRMYYNIADRVLNSTLKKNFDLVSGYAVDVQSELNSLANIGIKAQVPMLNQDRIDGLVNRLASEPSFDDVKWLLKEPIVNFSQSVVDDTIDKNVEFQAKAGLKPKITRRVVGKACKWCQSLSGSYDYPNVPHDIYRRHENCRCTVEYRPGDGKRQDVWSKRWTDPDKNAKIKERMTIGIDNERRKAEALLRTAKASEPQITSDIQESLKLTNAHLEGLDYRLKSIDSLVRKVKNEPGAKMRDVVRYTAISDSDELVSEYDTIMADLFRKGYDVSAVKNSWLDPENAYNGVNTNLISPKGYEFELQFHTQDSFEMKQFKQHSLYEEQRTVPMYGGRWWELQEQMLEESKSLNIPKNIERIGKHES